MKNILKKGIMALGSMLLLVSLSEAGVSIGLSWRSTWHHPDHRWSRWSPHYHAWVAVRPVYPVIVSEPLIVNEPVVVEEPVVSQSVQISDPQNYYQMLADFHVRFEQDRNLLNRQLAKGGITSTQFESEVNALNQISLEEHSKAARNNGTLSGTQIIELNRELEHVHKQIEQDLAE